MLASTAAASLAGRWPSTEPSTGVCAVRPPATGVAEIVRPACLEDVEVAHAAQASTVWRCVGA